MRKAAKQGKLKLPLAVFDLRFKSILNTKIKLDHYGPSFILVRKRGLEPPRPNGHQPLKLTRLPIPPLALIAHYILTDVAKLY